MGSNMAHAILALALGVTSSTTFVAMNSTLQYIAFPSYNLPSVKNAQKANVSSISPPAESSPELLLRQWALTYRTGHAIGPSSIVLSTICFIYAARTCPEDLRGLLYTAAASAAIGFPFTVVFILRINNELYRRENALMTSSDDKERAKIAGGDTLTLIKKCLWYSGVRVFMPIPAISIGIYAIYSMAKSAA